ncbi:glycoside hydrolase family 29 protein [Trametopsis cervina]|nr:glycoside hydrolase family 29 protein [Trametopsis cervina]
MSRRMLRSAQRYAFLGLCLDALTPVSAAVVQVDLSPVYNAKSAATGPNDTFADFDGFGRAYPAKFLPNGTLFTYQGIDFALPLFHNAIALDTVRADSQEVTLPNNTGFHSIHLLAVAVNGADNPDGGRSFALGNLNFNFLDGSTTETGVVFSSWFDTNPYNGPIYSPFYYQGKLSANISSIGYVTVRVPDSQPLQSITLPAGDSVVNIFSISLIASSNTSEGAILTVQNVRSTTKWIDTGATGDDRIQVIEVTLNNLAPLNSPTSKWINAAHNITLTSDYLDTVIPGTVVRVRSNDQIVVKVGVRNRAGVDAGSTANVTVNLVPDCLGCTAASLEDSVGWQVTAGIPAWSNTDESLRTHETPDWASSALYIPGMKTLMGLGVYSVPAWAPSGQQYAEWYDWQVRVPPNSSSPTWVHHKETYGESVVYDDFIANWTASDWDPSNWTDLFAGAGAKYFVLTSKHHDGFALFDTGNSSNRNSLKLGPKRDIVNDLFEDAKNRHPELHRGLYFSLPEWFNPAYGPYGQTSWPGHPALNAYTHDCCDPYIGYVEVNDYIADLQKPQMETLFYHYDTEITWGDIGGASAFPSIGGDWYNYAASQGRQVVMNNRMGAHQADFVTPEYATLPSPLFQKWETSQGMDPFSYGYNSDTPPENYQNASSVITELIDIVSKNGNFLLDIGPMADGTVIPEEREPLLQVGAWLSKAGDAIYGTRPWFITPQDQTSGLTDVRFTTSPFAFYVIAISRPANGTLQTAAPVPILPDDTVRLLGGSGQNLAWSVDSGIFSIQISDDELDLVNLPAWAFEIEYA